MPSSSVVIGPRWPSPSPSATISAVRSQAREIYRKIVAESPNTPRAAQVEEMTTILYGMQLALTLFWLQDLSSKASKTVELVAFLHDMLALIRPLLRLPVVSKALARLANIVGPMLEDTSAQKTELQDS